MRYETYKNQSISFREGLETFDFEALFIAKANIALKLKLLSIRLCDGEITEEDFATMQELLEDNALINVDLQRFSNIVDINRSTDFIDNVVFEGYKLDATEADFGVPENKKKGLIEKASSILLSARANAIDSWQNNSDACLAAIGVLVFYGILTM